jgi:hypothetical protein
LFGAVLAAGAPLACSDAQPRGETDGNEAGRSSLSGAGGGGKISRAGAPSGGQPTTAASGSAGQAGGIGKGDAGATDGTDSGGEPSASGGSASGGSASGGSASGAAQSDGNAGVAGESAGSAGQAGADNSAQQPLAGEACLACGSNECASVVDACHDNPECAPWLSCLKACDSQPCISACDASHAEVSRVYFGVYQCLCDACSAECDVAQSCGKQCVDDGALPPITVAPGTLAETGLYAEPAGAGDALLQVAPYVRYYETKYPLWSDGAAKERYVYLPSCATIDTSDMDHWSFPVGTRLWKNFSVDGQLVETRLIHRYGAGATDWLFATYGWDASKPNDPRAAVAVLHGQPRTNGTNHDIPDPSACTACHGKLPDKPLGFSAFQLSHSGDGLTMAKLSNWGWLTVPAAQGFEPPGTPVQRAALGYLHGNCGGCHNSYGEFPRDDPMKLRLLVGQTDYEQTDTVLTTIGVPTLNENTDLYGKPRIAPQEPNRSAIYLRMSNRDDYPMPPLGTKVADTDGGIAAVLAWIDSIPK